jgi:surface polysaccharide O-acyltransferase-like enzyme
MERVDHVSLESAAWAYLPIVPLALIQVTLRQRWPGIQNLIDDWANFAYYSLYFIVGFLLAGFPAVEHIVHREWKRSAAIGTVAMGLLWLCAVKLPHHPTVILGLTAVAGWCTVAAFLGLARRYVTTRSRTLSYLAASAFPVYLLHQSAITLLGHQMVQLPWGIAAKFVALLLISLATTLFVYHFGIRPLPALGFFFGIKPNDARRRSTPLIERWKIQPGRTTL